MACYYYSSIRFWYSVLEKGHPSASCLCFTRYDCLMQTLLHLCTTHYQVPGTDHTLCQATDISPPSPLPSRWLPAPTLGRPRHALLCETLGLTRCESFDTTIRKRWLLFAWAVARQSKERLPNLPMFGTMGGGENPRPGG